MTGWFTISQCLKLYVPQDSHSYNTLHTAHNQITPLETEMWISKTNTEAPKNVFAPVPQQQLLVCQTEKTNTTGISSDNS